MDSILAFAAHPDDEGAMLGTLAKYSKLSHKVNVVWATKGERWVAPLGDFSPLLHWFMVSRKNPEIRERLYNVIAKIREQEIEKVLKLLNIKGEFLGFIDGSVPTPSDTLALKKVIEAIRKSESRVVITHHFREGHPDHQNLSRLVYKAFYLANNPNIITKSATFKPEILAWWDERGIGFKPNCFINVRESIGIFKKWKSIFKSQKTRIVGQIPFIKSRLRAFRTPYRLVECFQIVNVDKKRWFGEFFPKL